MKEVCVQLLVYSAAGAGRGGKGEVDADLGAWWRLPSAALHRSKMVAFGRVLQSGRTSCAPTDEEFILGQDRHMPLSYLPGRRTGTTF